MVGAHLDGESIGSGIAFAPSRHACSHNHESLYQKEPVMSGIRSSCCFLPALDLEDSVALTAAYLSVTRVQVTMPNAALRALHLELIIV